MLSLVLFNFAACLNTYGSYHCISFAHGTINTAVDTLSVTQSDAPPPPANVNNEGNGVIQNDLNQDASKATNEVPNIKNSQLGYHDTRVANLQTNIVTNWQADEMSSSNQNSQLDQHDSEQYKAKWNPQADDAPTVREKEDSHLSTEVTEKEDSHLSTEVTETADSHLSTEVTETADSKLSKSDSNKEVASITDAPSIPELMSKSTDSTGNDSKFFHLVQIKINKSMKTGKIWENLVEVT